MPEHTQNKELDPETPTHKAPLLFTLILSCFFLSGVAGLIYEVLWVRMIDKVIGSAPFAVATVLSVFMGGLALGSTWRESTLTYTLQKKLAISIWEGGGRYRYLRAALTGFHNDGETVLCHSVQPPFSAFLDIPGLRLPGMLAATDPSHDPHGGCQCCVAFM
jgi:hypothetical protein